MNTLRLENDDMAAQVNDMKAKVKTLEEDNTAKAHEIKSLTHRNSVLEAEVDKLESGIKDAKTQADESSGHSKQNESLQRKLQVLEEEAEASDKQVRELNEK